MRALCGARRRARRPGPQKRDEQEEILVAARGIALHGLQCAQPGGGRGASRAPAGVMRNPIISAGCRSILRPSPLVLLDADEPLGVFDDEMEVAAYLAFEKLDRDRVEVLVDRSPMDVWTGWE